MEITLEQVERLREKADVSYSQAKQALEHTGGDLLEALIWLEGQGKAQAPQEGGSYVTHSQESDREVLNEIVSAGASTKNESSFPEKLLEFLMELLRKGVDNTLNVFHNDQVLVTIPVLAAIALVLIAPWAAIPLLVVGFVFGCRYGFTGPDLERPGVTKVMDTINGAVANLREQILDHVHSHKKNSNKEH